MRQVILNLPSPPDAEPHRLGRLTRHLNARLLDFGPGGPEVLEADQAQGHIAARFPGHETGKILTELAQLGVAAARDGDNALFLLQPQTRFEDLDYVWGCLFDLLL